MMNMTVILRIKLVDLILLCEMKRFKNMIKNSQLPQPPPYNQENVFVNIKPESDVLPPNYEDCMNDEQND